MRKLQLLLILPVCLCSANLLPINLLFRHQESSESLSFIKKQASDQTRKLPDQSKDKASAYSSISPLSNKKYPALKRFLDSEKIVFTINQSRGKTSDIINQDIRSLLIDFRPDENLRPMSPIIHRVARLTSLLESIPETDIGYCPSIKSPNQIYLDKFNQNLSKALRGLYSIPNTQRLTHDSRDSIWSPQLSTISRESYQEEQLFRLLDQLRQA